MSKKIKYIFLLTILVSLTSLCLYGLELPSYSSNSFVGDCDFIPENVALTGSATSSSSTLASPPERAIDGDPNGTIFHSATETDPWWQVDLAVPCPISSIVFYNRPGQTARANGLIIEVLDAGGAVVFTDSYPVAPNVITVPVTGITASAVRLRLVGDNRILNFNELEVYDGTSPVVTAFQATCTDGIPDDNAYLQLGGITFGDRFHFSQGTSFDDNGGTLTYANGQIINGSSVQTANNLPNPNVPTTYTVRLYNGSNTCFQDIQVTLLPQDCLISCQCTDYVYLNETTSNGAVHKYEVNPDGTLTEVPGSLGLPFYSSNNFPASESLPRPHGVTTDVNGNLFVGQNFNGDILKLNCLGDIKPSSEFSIPDGGFNLGSIDGKVYVNSASNPGIQAYDLCTGESEGYVDIISDAADWGFYVDENGTFYSTNGFGVFGDNHVTIFTPTEADFQANTLFPPTWVSDSSNPDPSVGDIGVVPLGNLGGITTDPMGNIYLVLEIAQTGFPTTRCSRIYKYSPAGQILAISADDCIGDGTGWNLAKGLIYSDACDCIFVSTESAIDDCVYVFDTNLNPIGTGVPPVADTQAKGIGITTECCPINNNVTIDTLLCANILNESIDLQDLLQCEGIICEGIWEEGSSNNGMVFDECSNNIMISTLPACGSFTFNSDGLATNNNCGAFIYTINVSVDFITPPVITGAQELCPEDDPTPLTIVTPATSASGSTVSYQWQMSTESCTSGFTDIVGQTTTTYDPPVGLTQTTYYRLVTSAPDSCSGESCTVMSNCITLTAATNCCPTENCFGIVVTRN